MMKGIFLFAAMLGMTIAGTYSATAKAATPSEMMTPAPAQDEENEADFGGCKYYCGGNGYTTLAGCAAACGGAAACEKIC